MRASVIGFLLVPVLLGACASAPEKPRGAFDLSSKPELSRPPADISSPVSAGPMTRVGAGGPPGGV
jgi:hypothetical protein